MIPHRIPRILLNNGVRIPMLGLGTWKSKKRDVIKAVATAIHLGYRHFDCAYAYENEVAVGIALHDHLLDKIVKREELFLTGKLWNTFHRPDLVEPAIKKSICDLKVDYLDLYLMHWPMAYQESYSDLVPMRDHKILYSNVHYLETWKAMERLINKGFTRSIGVSNFNRNQLQQILSCSCIKPVINQVECHPYLNQKNLIKFCRSQDIHVTCYSPLGSPDRPWASPSEVNLLQDSRLLLIAERYCKTPAQVLLRYQVQRGNIVIPKSIKPRRIRENMEIFDFELSQADMDELNCFNSGMRYVHLNRDSHHPHYPFKTEDSE